MSERREGVQRVPRSGGRTTERGTGDIRRTPVGAGTRVGGPRAAGLGAAGAEAVNGARGARRYPTRGGMTQGSVTQGSAALKLDAVQPARAPEVFVEPRLRVAPPAPVSAPRAPFVAVVIALVVAGVFGILLINTKTNENTFQIDRLRDQKASLDSQQRDLEAKLTDFNNPGSLRAMAKKLGLVESDSFAYIRLPDGKVILVPKPATSRPSITYQETQPAATGAGAPAGNAGNGTVADNGTVPGTGR